MRSIFLCSIVLTCGMATQAYAGKVELTTYYPAPDGRYTSINSTGNSNFATAGGNVGIGTTTPQAKLSVMQTVGAVNTGLLFSGDANGGVINANNDGVGGIARNLTLQGNGSNVGIGISNPGHALEVNGAISGRQTTRGWILGRGTYVQDTWLRLLNWNDATAYHGLAVGTFWANGLLRFDLAEMTPVKKEDALELGDAVVVDREVGLRVTRSSKPYDTAVYGIVSSEEQAAMVIGGDVAPGEAKIKGKLPIALIGRIKAKVSAENGAIEIGDLLTTSSTPGHLMKCTDRAKCFGAVAGKALEPLTSGQGAITVLATLQ